MEGRRKKNNIFEWLKDEDLNNNWSFKDVVWGLYEYVEINIIKEKCKNLLWISEEDYINVIIVNVNGDNDVIKVEKLWKKKWRWKER